jgi:hypothetical protein
MHTLIVHSGLHISWFNRYNYQGDITNGPCLSIAKYDIASQCLYMISQQYQHKISIHGRSLSQFSIPEVIKTTNHGSTAFLSFFFSALFLPEISGPDCRHCCRSLFGPCICKYQPRVSKYHTHLMGSWISLSNLIADNHWLGKRATSASTSRISSCRRGF